MTALIVVGVVLFLVVDAYIVYRVLASRRTADAHGATPVPGELELALPAGKLKLTYQESFRAPSHSDGSIDFSLPGALEVEVASAAGEWMEIRGAGIGGSGYSVSTGRGWSRAVVGTVQIPSPGIYTVTARGAIEGAVEPQILAGK